jgi:hypothetical protein
MQTFGTLPQCVPIALPTHNETWGRDRLHATQSINTPSIAKKAILK